MDDGFSQVDGKRGVPRDRKRQRNFNEERRTALVHRDVARHGHSLSFCSNSLAKTSRWLVELVKRTARKTMATKATRLDRPTTNTVADPFKRRHFNFRLLRSPALRAVITLMRLLIILMHPGRRQTETPNRCLRNGFPRYSLSFPLFIFPLPTVVYRALLHDPSI